MTKLEEIEKAVSSLAPEDRARFRDWFIEFDAKLWDDQIEQDAKAGNLNQLAAEAIRDHKAGRSRRL